MQLEPTLMSILAEKALGVDHIAIAVPDLESSIEFYSKVLGFHLKERRETKGRKTAMVSAVLEAGPLTFVLVQGTTPESQVSRFIEHYGPGVQHIAIGVSDLPEVAARLKDAGLAFDTTVIEGS
ncbi:MAG: VOC family protein, partial [Acidobacteria bacterium]|nr:VOC family protein [Acidobacteriota bacterium]